jgi:hypothetical protein
MRDADADAMHVRDAVPSDAVHARAMRDAALTCGRMHDAMRSAMRSVRCVHVFDTMRCDTMRAPMRGCTMYVRLMRDAMRAI